MLCVTRLLAGWARRSSGTGSAFEVVRSTSLNAMSADELEQLAARAEDALAAAEGRPMLEAVTNHAEVWRDYTGSALTLLDARDRGRALAVREGADLGVVSAVAVVGASRGGGVHTGRARSPRGGESAHRIVRLAGGDLAGISIGGHRCGGTGQQSRASGP